MSDTQKQQSKFDVIYTDSTEVYCEGNGPALGHPRIYLDLSRKGMVDCPYCSRRFIVKHKE